MERSLRAVAVTTAFTIGSVDASPRAACNIISIADVRAIIGDSVSILNPDKNLLTQIDGARNGSGRSALLNLVYAPASKLAAMNAKYRAKSKKTAGVFAAVRVATRDAIDLAASNKLLAAVLQKI